MHQSINMNQLADSLHQRIADCASLHRMLIQDNQHNQPTKPVKYFGSGRYEFEIYVIVNRNSIIKLYTVEHFIQRKGSVVVSILIHCKTIV